MGDDILTALTVILAITQIIFMITAIYYFCDTSKSRNVQRSSLNSESKKEMIRIQKMRSSKLTKPLSEALRPQSIEEIVGQKDGILALKAAICTGNPQHVIIYGPPGIGKTAAARLLLEEAKKDINSPFNENSKFIEIDATTLRFDERSIADPLIGSVHDPIYQGAGNYGNLGIPKPQEGAVTKANGGILFIDEIGELHSVQMNKLLKVLEDRVVYFTSSYYNSCDANIPEYIHDIFKNGLPADFRLIGATTRSPDDIPPALRSRCTEIFFSELSSENIMEISKRAFSKINLDHESDVIEKISNYTNNGRDAINIVQMSASLCKINKVSKVTTEEIDWVTEKCRIKPIYIKKASKTARIGRAYGLGVSNTEKGMLIEIEVVSEPAKTKGDGTFNITGIICDEELTLKNCKKIRKSNIYSSVMNVLTALKIYGIDYKDYNIHINLPGGVLVDGPSAGIAFFAALYSSIAKIPVNPNIAMTGEITISGYVFPVGGVKQKIEGALLSGIGTVFVPYENKSHQLETDGIKIVYVKSTSDIMKLIFNQEIEENENEKDLAVIDILSAEGR